MPDGSEGTPLTDIAPDRRHIGNRVSPNYGVNELNQARH